MTITEPTTRHPRASRPRSSWSPARVRRLRQDRAVVALLAEGATFGQVCAAGVASSPAAVRAAVGRALALVRWDGDVPAARTVEHERHELLWPPLLGSLRAAVSSRPVTASQRLLGAAMVLFDRQMALVGWCTRPLDGPAERPPLHPVDTETAGEWSELLERRADGERPGVLARRFGVDPSEIDALISRDAAAFFAPEVARYRTRTCARLDLDTRDRWLAATDPAGVDAAAVRRIAAASGERIGLLGLEQSVDPHAPRPTVHPASTMLRKDLS